MTINTLFFDLDNTLINTNAIKLSWVLQHHPVFSKMVSSDHYINADDPITRNKLFKLIAKSTSTSTDQIQQHFQAFLYQQININAALLEFLKEYKTRYTLGIITNGSLKNQQKKIALAGLKPFFETIIISGKLGIRKPDKAIFEYALNKTKSEAENTLFIGDSLENDIAGAQQLGLKTCWVNPHTYPPHIQTRATYKIDQILALKKLLSSETFN